jgi:Spy/CpxP family protein refolding chaperone
MRIVGKLLLTVALAGVLVGLGLAQRPGFPGGFGGSTGALLRNEGVQKELKLSEDQIEKVKKATQEVQEKFKGDFEKLKGLDKAEAREKFGELFKKIGAETDKAVSGILKPEQAKRLRQIQLQQMGSQAFSEEDVVKALKITDDQKEKIKTIREDAGKEMRELFKGGNFEEAQKKMAALRKETMEKVQAVLSADQKKAWKDLTGEPFEVKFERRPFGKKRLSDKE